MTRRSVILLVLVSACASRRGTSAFGYTGHDPATLENVSVVPGPMPSGESFTGFYHSQEIGDVNLQQTGDQVIGSYEYDRAACHARGRIEGRVEGNLLRFTWTEDQRECGRPAIPPGHGYFLFWIDSARNGRVNGEWGFGEEESGNGRWSLFRVPNRRANVGGSGSEGGESGAGTSGSSSSGSTSSGTSTPTTNNDPLQGL